MLFAIQIILIVFFGFALVKVVGRYRAGELRKKDAIIWVCFWLLASAVVLAPNSTALAAKLFGIGRGADLVIYVALAGIFFVIFRLMVSIERLHTQITVLTRKISLQDALKKPDDQI